MQEGQCLRSGHCCCHWSTGCCGAAQHCAFQRGRVRAFNVVAAGAQAVGHGLRWALQGGRAGKSGTFFDNRLDDAQALQPQLVLRLLQHFSQRLARLAEPGHAPETLAALVSGGGFPAASYRLSLLALLADAGAEGESNAPADGPIGDFMRLPLDVHFDAATVAVGSDEIATMSAGLVGARGSLPAPQAVPVLDATALPPDEA